MGEEMEAILLLGGFGVVGAYFFIPSFKKTIDDALGGVGDGGGQCAALGVSGTCQVLKAASGSEKALRGKTVIVAMIATYKKPPAITQSQVTALMGKVSTNDGLAVFNAGLNTCNSGCTAASLDSFWNAIRTPAIKYAKASNIALNPIPVHSPPPTSGLARVVSMLARRR